MTKARRRWREFGRREHDEPPSEIDARQLSGFSGAGGLDVGRARGELPRRGSVPRLSRAGVEVEAG